MLKNLGLRVGERTFLPESTWIDTSCPYAIRIGSDVGFGPECLILAHDAQMRVLLGVTRIAKVVIHDQCRIGARTLILPGVEIGPRTIVFAGSVVSRSLPPDSACAGSPARVIGSVDQYIETCREQLGRVPNFPADPYGRLGLPPEYQSVIAKALETSDVFVIGSEGVDPGH